MTQLGITQQVIETQGSLLRIADDAQANVLAQLVKANIPIVSLTPVNQTLEEVYVRTTQASDTAIAVSKKA